MKRVLRLRWRPPSFNFVDKRDTSRHKFFFCKLWKRGIKDLKQTRFWLQRVIISLLLPSVLQTAAGLRVHAQPRDNWVWNKARDSDPFCSACRLALQHYDPDLRLAPNNIKNRKMGSWCSRVLAGNYQGKFPESPQGGGIHTDKSIIGWYQEEKEKKRNDSWLNLNWDFESDKCLCEVGDMFCKTHRNVVGSEMISTLYLQIKESYLLMIITHWRHELYC